MKIQRETLKKRLRQIRDVGETKTGTIESTCADALQYIAALEDVLRLSFCFGKEMEDPPKWNPAFFEALGMDTPKDES